MITCVKQQCQTYFKTIYLPKDTWLFEGWGKREFDPSTKQYYVFHKGDIMGRTQTISFYTSKLDESVKAYAKPNGYVAIYRTKRNIQLIAQINFPPDPECPLFFVSKEDYQSSEAQCFCKEANGYATIILEDKKVTNITDIAICNAEDLLEPVGYVYVTEPTVIRRWTDNHVIPEHTIRRYRNSVGLNKARLDILPFKTVLGL